MENLRRRSVNLRVIASNLTIKDCFFFIVYSTGLWKVIDCKATVIEASDLK